MPTLHEALRRAIPKWKGGFQAQPQDLGNYVTVPDGGRRLVGTMRRVTPDVVAAHRGVPVQSLTTGVIQSVTLGEATEISLIRFYKGTGLDLLPWSRRPERSLISRGVPGPARQRARCGACWVSWSMVPSGRSPWRLCPEDGGAGLGEAATRAVRDMRVAFYDLIIQHNGQLALYRQGWRNRAN